MIVTLTRTQRQSPTRQFLPLASLFSLYPTPTMDPSKGIGVPHDVFVNVPFEMLSPRARGAASTSSDAYSAPSPAAGRAFGSGGSDSDGGASARSSGGGGAFLPPLPPVPIAATASTVLDFPLTSPSDAADGSPTIGGRRVLVAASSRPLHVLQGTFAAAPPQPQRTAMPVRMRPLNSPVGFLRPQAPSAANAAANAARRLPPERRLTKGGGFNEEVEDLSVAVACAYLRGQRSGNRAAALSILNAVPSG